MDDNWKLEKIREFAASEKAYRPPKAPKSGNNSENHDLDEIKLHELKEVSELNLIVIATQQNLNLVISSGTVLQLIRFK